MQDSCSLNRDSNRVPSVCVTEILSTNKRAWQTENRKQNYSTTESNTTTRREPRGQTTAKTKCFSASVPRCFQISYSVRVFQQIQQMFTSYCSDSESCRLTCFSCCVLNCCCFNISNKMDRLVGKGNTCALHQLDLSSSQIRDKITIVSYSASSTQLLYFRFTGS
jgi:hypothetical protein